MTVSSKWYVSGVEGQKVSMYPVCRGVENREWASATPGGQMTMFITNPAALAAFTPGEEYEAIFTHRPKPAPNDGHAVEPVTLRSFEGTPAEKVVYLCGRCGSYARLNEDGTPNWEAHVEHFGVPSA